SGKGFEPGRMAAGLGIDIALDPLTYIPFVGLAGAVGKAGKGVLKARPGIQAGQEAGSATAAVAKEAPLQITAGGSGRHFSVDAAGEAVEKGTWFPKVNPRGAAYEELTSGKEIVSSRAWEKFVQSSTG